MEVLPLVDESRWVLPEDSVATGNVQLVDFWFGLRSLKEVDEGGMQILLEDEQLKLV